MSIKKLISTSFENLMIKLILYFKLSYKRRLAIYRMLEKMTNEPANLQINDAIQELQLLAGKHKYRKVMWYIFADILEQMRNSDANFAKAIAKYVPQQDAMILAAAELDDITAGFTAVIENNIVTATMRNAFISALGYPLGMLCALLVVLYYFSVNIIPAMTKAIPSNVELSPISTTIIALSNYFNIWFPVLLLVIISSISFIIWALPRFNGGLRLYLENLPPFNMYRILVGCGFLFALNSLGRAGYMQIDALLQMLPLAKPYLRYRIQIIIHKMGEGLDIGQALIQSGLNFPDREILQEFAIQIKYNNDDSLELLAKTLAQDGIENIKRQALLLKILAIALIFSIIGFLYVGVYSLGVDMGNINT